VTVDGNTALVVFVKPRQQVNDRRFARPGRSDKSDGFSRQSFQADILQRGHPSRVGERNPLVNHPPTDLRQTAVIVNAGFGDRVKNPKDALACRQAGKNQLVELMKAGDRFVKIRG